VSRNPGTLVLLVLRAGVPGCTGGEDPQPRQATRLTATLVSPTDVTLQWKGDEPGAAGWVVEYATDPHGQYTVLEFAP
jgi:hypothetical protein